MIEEKSFVISITVPKVKEDWVFPCFGFWRHGDECGLRTIVSDKLARQEGVTEAVICSIVSTLWYGDVSVERDISCRLMEYTVTFSRPRAQGVELPRWQ